MKYKIMLLSHIVSIYSFSNEIDIKDDKTYVDVAPNGTEVININSSNNGISVSEFNKFNIDKDIIINNSPNLYNSKLAGYINGNKNLEESAKVSVINIFDTDKTKLNATIEGASKNPFDIFFFNRNGFSVNNGKFINFNNLTFTTKEVNVGSNNEINLNGINDNIGTIDISSLQTNANALNIVSELSNLEETYAKDINIVSGVNNVTINNNDFIVTESKEIGVPITTNLNSVYADQIRVIATKSGVGVNSVIAKENIDVKADNLTNKFMLAKENITLNLKNNLYNTDGSVIYSGNLLKGKAFNIFNIGTVKNFGDVTIKYKDNEGNEHNLDNFFMDIGYSFLRRRILYDLTNEDIDYHLNVIKNSTRMPNFNITKYFNIYKENMKKFKGHELLDHDHYLNESNVVLTPEVIITNQDTKFSMLLGKNIELDVDNEIMNENAHILADENLTINSNNFTNKTSVKDITLKQGVENIEQKVKIRSNIGIVGHYSSLFKYNRKLEEIPFVLKAMKSTLGGSNININAKNKVFLGYDQGAVFNPSSIDIHTKYDEKIALINNKEIKYTLENRPEYTSIDKFYQKNYFLNNIDYNKANIDISKVFSFLDVNVTNNLDLTIVKSSNKGSNLSIYAKNIEISNTNLNANNLTLNGDTDINSSDITANTINVDNGTLNVKSNVLTREFSEFHNDKNNFKYTMEYTKASNIIANNLNLNNDVTNIIGSNVIVNNLNSQNTLNVTSQILNASLRQSFDEAKLLSYVSSKIERDTQTDTASNLKVLNNADINKLNVASSNIDLNNATINEFDVTSNKLNQRYRENSIENGLFLDGSYSFSGASAEVGYKNTVINNEMTAETYSKSNIKLNNTTINNKFDVKNANIYDSKNVTVNAKNATFGVLENKEYTKNMTNEFKIYLRANASSDILSLYDPSNIIQPVRYANKFVSTVNTLKNNITIYDKDKNKLETTMDNLKKAHSIDKNINGYINVGLTFGINNKNSYSNIKKMTAAENNIYNSEITFNNNEQVNFINTNASKSSLTFNNVNEVNKLAHKNTIESLNNVNEIDISGSSKIDLKTGQVGMPTVNVSVNNSLSNTKMTTYNNALFDDVTEIHNNTKKLNVKGYNHTN